MLLEVKSNSDVDDKRTTPFLICFTSSWCGACKKVKPVLEEFSKQMDVYLLDVNDWPKHVEKYNINVIPTIFFIKDNDIKEKVTGYKTMFDLVTIKSNLGF